jgi:CRP/FNR family transcriptional regulator, cyclic AMP receptor protein
MSTLGSSALAFAPQTIREDPFAQLPRTAVIEYKKKRLIYSQDRPSTGFHLIVSGKVKVCRLADGHEEVVVDIYRDGDLFGESALLGLSQHVEQATALENTSVMIWTAGEIEELVARQPKLAMALWRVLVRRTIEFGQRIESFSLENVAQRLARSLLRYSERLGAPGEDGSIRMAALTHEMLAQHVGTSREIVTHYMNHFRRQGYLNYSRREISLYRDPFEQWLREKPSAAC